MKANKPAPYLQNTKGQLKVRETLKLCSQISSRFKAEDSKLQSVD